LFLLRDSQDPLHILTVTVRTDVETIRHIRVEYTEGKTWRLLESLKYTISITYMHVLVSAQIEGYQMVKPLVEFSHHFGPPLISEGERTFQHNHFDAVLYSVNPFRCRLIKSATFQL